MDCGTVQATDRDYLPATGATVLSTSTGPECGRTTACGLLLNGGESESGLQPVGSPANWRCVVLAKLGKVRLLGDVWRTAPNHSRPGSCVTKPDMDVQDYPELDPQNGHGGSCLSRCWPSMILKVAIECGL